MLPDETLRQETRQFTIVNRWLLSLLLGFGAVVLFAGHSAMQDNVLTRLLDFAVRFHRAIFIALLLLPIAMTMALIWKTKEVILESVFGGDR
jgi:ABC-type methionine transport system permease subunit